MKSRKSHGIPAVVYKSPSKKKAKSPLKKKKKEARQREQKQRRVVQQMEKLSTMPQQPQQMEVEQDANLDHHRSNSQASFGGKSIIDEHVD